MNAEIISVGAELIYGATMDSNAKYLAKLLAKRGIRVSGVSVVPDDRKIIRSKLAEIVKRTDLIFLTGGLGPTEDDVTKEVVADFLDLEMVQDEAIVQDMVDKFRRRGLSLPVSNLQQAMTPVGAEVLNNSEGTAPGLAISSERKTFILLPGVPSELRAILSPVTDRILREHRTGNYRIMKTIRTFGLPESEIQDRMAEFKNRFRGLEPAFNASCRGIDVSLVGWGESALEKRIEGEMELIRKALGNYAYGNEKDTLPEVAGRMLIERKETLAVAESCTGGMLGSLITDVPGASGYFLGGVIAYDNRIKEEQLSVPREELTEYGAVSKQVALFMAEGVRLRLKADYGLSVTGIAGPDGGTEEKPMGLVYLGCAGPKGTRVRRTLFRGERDLIRNRSAYSALNMLRRYIIENDDAEQR